MGETTGSYTLALIMREIFFFFVSREIVNNLFIVHLFGIDSQIHNEAVKERRKNRNVRKKRKLCIFARYFFLKEKDYRNLLGEILFHF